MPPPKLVSAGMSKLSAPLRRRAGERRAVRGPQEGERPRVRAPPATAGMTVPRMQWGRGDTCPRLRSHRVNPKFEIPCEPQPCSVVAGSQRGLLLPARGLRTPVCDLPEG